MLMIAFGSFAFFALPSFLCLSYIFTSSLILQNWLQWPTPYYMLWISIGPDCDFIPISPECDYIPIGPECDFNPIGPERDITQIAFGETLPPSPLNRFGVKTLQNKINWCENVTLWTGSKTFWMIIFWCQMVTIQIDLVWKRYIIWCESVTNSLLVRNRYNIQSVWCENVAIQSNLVWKRYNINSIWNNFVWLILGAKSLQYKVIWCENDT